MIYLYWTLIIILFILSFIGVFVPIIPAVLLLWGGFLLYHFMIDTESLSVIFWVASLVLTGVLFIADFWTNRYYVKKYGGSKKSEWGAIVGIIIGTFLFPPFSIIILPLLFVFLVELTERKTVKEATLAMYGAFLGFLSGVFAKVFIQLMMIIFFIIQIIF